MKDKRQLSENQIKVDPMAAHNEEWPDKLYKNNVIIKIL